MINTIRADSYRLFHSKGFYINQLLLIGLVVLSVGTEALGSVGISHDSLQQLQEQVTQAKWSGANTLIAMSTMSSFLMYFCLPLFVMTIGFDLSKKTLKNLISSGISRGEFFFSKYIVFLVTILMQFAFYYGLSFLTAAIKNGVGDFGVNYFENFFRTLGVQYLSINAIFAFGLLALYLCFSNIAAVLAVVILPIATGIITIIYSKVKVLQYISFQGSMDSAWLSLPDNFWLNTMIAAVLVIICCGTLSLISFKKRDL